MFNITEVFKINTKETLYAKEKTQSDFSPNRDTPKNKGFKVEITNFERS